jgi:segregation and condensation protein A
MSFTVNVDQFEGPLDLMLHLIKENNMDIFDLDISILCQQYINYLNLMTDLKLEVESEYLIELATLVEYKSRKLLPKENAKIEEEYEDDPEERLVKRLLEYQQFKEASEILEKFYKQRLLQVSKPLSIETDKWLKSDESKPVDQNPYDLVKAMNKVLKRLQLSKPIERTFRKKELSIDDKIVEIKARLLDMNDTFTFEDLVRDEIDVNHVVVSFLAVLDLAKQHLLYFTIDDQENIHFRKG